MVAAAIACAAVLHLAIDRTGAVWVVPIALCWGLWAVVRGRTLPDIGPGGLVLVALMVRFPLLGTPLHLSDDLYRYLWEGKALLAGHDVYVLAPASIPGLDDPLRALVNHPEVPSVYPPLALIWFTFLSWLGTPGGVQLATAVADALVPLAIRSATGRAGLAWIYVLHPLPALESAAGGHVDIPAVALAACGIALWRRNQRDAAWIAVVASALTKLFPLAFLVVLLRAVPPRRALLWVTGAVIATVLSLLPLVPALDGLGRYATGWEFNGFLHPWLVPWLGQAARPVLLGLAGLAAVAVWIRVRDPGDAWFWLGTVFLCTSPTVHPWYVVWALVPSLLTGRMHWVWASLPLMGGYLVLSAFDPATGTWSEAGWLWWVTWPAALAGWLYGRHVTEALPTAPYPSANSSRNGSDAA